MGFLVEGSAAAESRRTAQGMGAMVASWGDGVVGFDIGLGTSEGGLDDLTGKYSGSNNTECSGFDMGTG